MAVKAKDKVVVVNMPEKETKLSELKCSVEQCRLCKLSSTRTKVVFGEGRADADIMFIGEGPGKDEDLQGRPFVGRAGMMLTAIIEKGMKIERKNVYIANLVKCRPTENMEFKKDRPPDEEEVSFCSPYLLKQIEIISPKIIITLGNPSTRFILKTKEGITKMRGNWGFYNNIPVMPTYHPSYLIRSGNDSSPAKKDVWNDIKLVLKYLAGEIMFKKEAEKADKTGLLETMNKIQNDSFQKVPKEQKEQKEQGELF